MTSTLTFAPTAVRRQIFRIVRQHQVVRVRRLRPRLHLVRELCLELLDVVDILLDLEHYFHIHIPDEVPFLTVGDLVNYVTAETQSRLRA